MADGDLYRIWPFAAAAAAVAAGLKGWDSGCADSSAADSRFIDGGGEEIGIGWETGE